MSAAMQAGITSFAILSLFLGVGCYVNTFVAQYYGAGRDERTGPSIWQGVYFSVVSAILILVFIPLAGPIFAWMGHGPVIREYEILYFRIMCIGALPGLLAAVLSGFFTGRSKTKTVMYVNLSATLLNIILDYSLIFGKFGFPELGIVGAGWATVAAISFSVMLYFCLFFRRRNRINCATLSGWRFDFALFKRLIRFGLPNGVQFLLDVCAFAVFIMLVGRIDRIALAATSIAFGINSLAFMPMLGIGVAVSTLVGQALGKSEPDIAQRSTWSGFYITYIYMALIALGYWLLPKVFLYPFAIKADVSEYVLIEPVAIRLLCFVAFYCLFDAGTIIFSSALKGAGDTRFVMIIALTLGWSIMVLPSWLAVKFGLGLYVAWSFTTAYICILGIVFLLRFLSGKWKRMRVIEPTPLAVPTKIPQVPTVEIEAT